MSPTRVLCAFWVLAAQKKKPAWAGQQRERSQQSHACYDYAQRAPCSALPRTSPRETESSFLVPQKADRCEIFWSPGEKLAQFR